MTAPKTWDVFICHASDDKDTFVRPLAEALVRLGLRVWFDEFSLSVGDSLVRSIDKGLAESSFGIVVLSPAFIGKKWTEHELRGLVTRDIEEGGVILPLWHGITKDEVIRFSPPLADKLAIDTSRTELEDAGLQILQKVRRDLYEKHPRAVLLGMARDEPVAADAAKRPSEETEFVSRLAQALVDVLVWADEAEDRQVTPWLDAWRGRFAVDAEEFRELASQDIAEKLGVTRNLADLADALDEVAAMHLHLGCGDELAESTKKAADAARTLKADLIDSRPISDDSKVAVPNVIRKAARRLADLVERMQALANAGRVGHVQTEAARIGADLVRFGYYKVDAIRDGLGAALRDVGHKLHLVETTELYLDGGASERQILNHIQEQHDALVTLVRDLPVR
jgi:hypothetical protein